jgi:hypothetical protein
MSREPLALGEDRRFDSLATGLVLWAIAYLDDAQACPCCTLGHEPEDVEMFSMHDEGCPFQGFERTVEVERLRAWAALRVTDGGGAGG